MLNKLKFSLAACLLMSIAMACGSTGMIGSDDQTALVGVVLDSESYERIADATVRLVGEDKSTTTNENGVFTFVDVGVGTQEILVESGNVSNESSIDVEAGGSRVELKIER